MMKRLIYSVLFGLCWMGTLRAQCALSVSTPVEQDGDWIVEIALENPDTKVTSMQFDLTIPADFSYTAGNYVFSSRATTKKLGKDVDTHSMVSNSVTGGGTIRAIIYSSDNIVIKENSGILVSIILEGKGTAKATPCNLTNIVVTAVDADGAVIPVPVYPQAQVGDDALSCYDCMDDDAFVIGELSEAKQEELKLMLATNQNVKLVDLSRCPTESLGLLTLYNRDAVIICEHEGQVANTEGVIYKSGDGYVCSLLKLFDSAKYYLLPVDVTATSVEYTRDFPHLNWNAYYMPVEVPVSTLIDEYDLAEIRSMEADDDYVYLRIGYITSGTLAPNTPYLIRAHATGERVIKWNNVKVEHAAEKSLTFDLGDAVYTFTGNYSKNCDLFANGGYAMGGGTLHPALDAETMLGAFRWFMGISAATPAALGRQFSIVLDEDASGIESLSDIKAKDNANDLLGRKVKGNTNTQIYVQNGKKVMAK